MSNAPVSVEFLNAHASTIYFAKTADFDVDSLSVVLSEEENAKAGRFRQLEDRQLQILAHSLKRAVLSKYLSVSPASLEFSTEFNGKPVCVYPNAPYFNLTHSHGWVALAVSMYSQVGVDIEFERSNIRIDDIVARVASPQELSIYQCSEDPMQAFLCLWTQKEALSKACGLGLSVGPPSIPSSSVTGKARLEFLHTSYTSYTYSIHSKAVLTYVEEHYESNNHSPPVLLYAKPHKELDTEQLFEFDVFTLY
ncbi:4'-phosphopantetheinyl transferase family protein [Eionea flava]